MSGFGKRKREARIYCIAIFLLTLQTSHSVVNEWNVKHELMLVFYGQRLSYHFVLYFEQTAVERI